MVKERIGERVDDEEKGLLSNSARMKGRISVGG